MNFEDVESEENKMMFDYCEEYFSSMSNKILLWQC